MQKIITINTDRRERLYDITEEAKDFVLETGIKAGLVNIYAQGATSAVMVQENWDESVQEDVIDFLAKLIPKVFGSMTRKTAMATPI